MKSSSTAPTITSAAAASSVSGEDSDYWAPTVSKRAEEDVVEICCSTCVEATPHGGKYGYK